MIDSIKKIVRDVFTESDNTTHDLYRYLSLFAIIAGIGCQLYAIYKGQKFDMQEFGIGMGALLAGVGVALGLKKEKVLSEPA